MATIDGIVPAEILATYPVNATGDVVSGDAVLFSEALFTGSVRSPRFAGYRWIAARVLRDSYGAAKQQHTFTLQVVASGGVQPLDAGTVTRRKGRNVYRNGVFRRVWDNEADRGAAAQEKHTRGDAARKAREVRREEMRMGRFSC